MSRRSPVLDPSREAGLLLVAQLGCSTPLHEHNPDHRRRPYRGLSPFGLARSPARALERSFCRLSVMASEKCERCSLPLVELDAYGERLRGCIGCNNWQSISSGEWRQLPEEDIAALRGLEWRWPRS
jgi:hypothetical protein